MILQMLLSTILLAAFVVVAAYNGYIAWARWQDREAPSLVPLVGGLAGTAGLLVWPHHEPGLWTVAPAWLDSGCAPYLCVFGFDEMRQRWRYREKKRFLRLVGESDAKRVEIGFYFGGRLRFEVVVHHPTKLGEFSSNGKWRALDGGGYALRIWDASLTLENGAGHWHVIEESGWFTEDLSIAAVVLHTI